MTESSAGPSSLPNFEEYNSQLQAAALKATRNAVFLPNDLNFYRSMDRGVAKEVDACSSRVLSLANRLLDLVSTSDSSSLKAKGKATLEHDDVTDNFRSSVVDSMDRLLERADICLDEFLGLTKAPAIAVNMKPIDTKQKTSKKSTPVPGRLDPALQHASHLPKPQLKFKRAVNNFDSSPWRPTLRHKYNAQVPLGYDLSNKDDDLDMDSAPHPYRYEVKNISYPARMFTFAEPIPPKSFEETPFKWVETPAELADMLDDLRTAKEIAVDLEYHSYRSFAGFVCLMQISTREGDWIVDTLSLREELEELNEVFTDPQVVKVFHGAESDIVWLQQDFNLYIVNLFDTYHASKVLDFPRHGLVTLMEMYCDFTPDKRYQLADWRIRPLPEEMLHYARSDTHFLLYIYDNLRNALIDRAQSRVHSPAGTPQPQSSVSSSTDPAHALVREVLLRSEETALRVYQREVYDAESGSGPGGWDTLASKWNRGALMASERESARRRVYMAVHAWRDRVAREADESTRYVLLNHQLFILAEQPPMNMSALLGVFQHVPAVVRRLAQELLAIIRKAVAEEIPAARDIVDREAAPNEAVDVIMTADSDQGRSAEPTVSVDDVQLWPGAAHLSKPKISSSLFGASLDSRKPKSSQRLYAASRSSLFSDSVFPQSSSHKLKIRDVIARIHGTLAIAPSTPTLPSPFLETASAGVVAVEIEEESVAEQVEIPFVPASERQDKAQTVAPVKDSIVVVGQPHRKKRRREKKASAMTTPRSDSDVAADEMPFDYSTVSNILDEGSDHEPAGAVGSGRKRKQRQQGQPESGGFRAPPKDPSEVRRGNQSRTFK